MRFLARWPVTLLFAVATIVLSLCGYFIQWKQHPVTPLDWLIQTISLFKMSWAWGYPNAPTPWTIELARWTGAVFTISALAKVWMRFFGEQMTRLRLRLRAPDVIVCGLGRKGLKIAQEFHDRGELVAVLDSSPDEEYASLCRRDGILLVVGDATKDETLDEVNAARAKKIFAVCRDDRTNLEIAMAALAHCKARPAGNVTCYAHLVSLPLRVLLQRHNLLRQRPAHFDLKFFNVFENTARTLLAQHPLESAAGERAHLVVVGLTRLGEAVATQAARIGHFADGRPLRLTLLDEQADLRGEQFLTRQPGLAEACALTVEKVRWTESHFTMLRFLDATEPEKVTVVFCLEQDETNVSLALSLAERHRPGVTFVAIISEREGLARLLTSSAEELAREHVQIVDAVEDVAEWDILQGEKNDALAREFSEFYRKQYGGPEWADLSEDLRNSNRAAADHIDVKLRAIGASRVPKGSPGDPFQFTAAEIELLAQVEHRRWSADRLLNGWVLGPKKDPTNKIHPDLIPWDDLPEAAKDKDREQVRDLPAILERLGETIRR